MLHSDIVPERGLRERALRPDMARRQVRHWPPGNAGRSRRCLELRATARQARPWNTGHFTEELVSCPSNVIPNTTACSALRVSLRGVFNG